MLTLHGALVDDRLAVWVETEARRIVKRAFGATARELDDVVAQPGADENRVIWLPTAAKRPLPSSVLMGDASAGAPAMASWTISTRLLDVHATVDLLAGVVGKRLLAPGVLVGQGLAFLATATRFAGALVARGHVLPSLELIDGRWHARWSIAPVPGEQLQLASLLRAMPPSVLAIRKTAVQPDRRQQLDRFLLALVDSFMRERRVVRTRRFGSSHDAWMAALSSADNVVNANQVELETLGQAIRDWRRVVAEGAQHDFRTAFRLEEPREDSDVWTIRFLLQGIEDPSLIVPLSVLWNDDKRDEDGAAVRRLLRRGHGEARRFILSSLGQAASMSTAVDEALRQPSPSAITTDTTGAFAFLTTDAAALEGAGFGVFLPSWWSRKGTKRRLTLRAKTTASKFKSKGKALDALMEVQWKIALGDEELSIGELQALARLKMSLVRIRGQWMQLDAAEIKEALRFAREKGTRRTAGELVQMSLTGEASGAELLEVEAVTGSGVFGTLLDRLKGKSALEELPAPSGFTGTLRPYQSRGFAWLSFLTSAGLGACLADDMGLGKTIQTLAMIQRSWLESERPVLLICPTSVTGNWIREAARFTPDLPVLLHHGADRARGDDFVATATASCIVVSSYSLLARDVDLLNRVDWKGIVLDEAQNIKNAQTRQSKSARSLKAGFRIALTGTPVENNIGDLWSIIDFLNPGFLGSPSSFRDRFFIPIQTQRDPGAMDDLRKLTGPLILRRLKTDRAIIADLPMKNEMKVYCTLTREQATLYQAVVQEAEAQIESADGIGRKGTILATIARLKQACNHPAQLLGDGSPVGARSGKVARLHEMLSEALDSGDRALVFTQFAEMGTMLQRYLQEHFGQEVLFLHGGTPRAQRDKMVERFQAESDGPSIFILSLKAGGTGLNLTRASHVFHFDRWWNPAVENQATDRAFRIGQKKPVQVHKFICGGTFEERIDEMIEGKSQLAESVVGTGEGWLTKLSNSALRELFKLRADAVGE